MCLIKYHIKINQIKYKVLIFEWNCKWVLLTLKAKETLSSWEWKKKMFKYHKLSSIFLLIIIILFFLSYLAKSQIFIYYACSEEKFQPNTPSETNLNSLLSLFVSSSSQALYKSFAIGNDTNASSESSVYGLYQCRGDLRTQECTKCVKKAVSEVGLACPNSYSGGLELDECSVRFEHFDFLGELDTSIRFKKCSKSASHDGEFIRRRDDV